jgi:hypothetical protein
MTVSTAYLPLVLSAIIFWVWAVGVAAGRRLRLQVQRSRRFPSARLRQSTSSTLSGLVDLGLICHSTALRSLKTAEVQSRFSKEKR